jgi:hypothetical protein
MKQLLSFLLFMHQLAKLSLIIELLMMLAYIIIYRTELFNKIVFNRLILVVAIPLTILIASKYLINIIRTKVGNPNSN